MLAGKMMQGESVKSFLSRHFCVILIGKLGLEGFVQWARAGHLLLKASKVFFCWLRSRPVCFLPSLVCAFWSEGVRLYVS